jgi:branched-chain amino acid transport system ATP-binding protein
VSSVALDGNASTGSADESEALVLKGVSLGYRDVIVIQDMNMLVRRGEVVALLGANGSGKTTTLKGCVGLLQPTKGTIEVFGDGRKAPLHRRARAGVALVPEERAIVPGLTVIDNLRLAGVSVSRVVDVFPVLGDLLKRKAGLLSGGEQQMLVLGRIFASDPRIVLADELSLGLAPQIVGRLLGAIRQYADKGGTVVLVEQQIRNALTVADRAYVLRRGQIVMEGTGTELQSRVVEIEDHYL